MSNLSVFKNANLPSVKDLAVALKSNASSQTLGTNAIIKMDKTGHWVYGADAEEVEDGTLWALNPFSFVHGFIAWGNGEVLGEVMSMMHEPLPATDVAPPEARRGWEKQLGFEITCLSGQYKGLTCRYATTSVGGLRAVSELGVLLASQIDKDADHPVAILSLGKEHYLHKTYGKIYTPVFEVVRWDSMDVETSKEAQDELEFEDEEEAPVPAPTRRRRG